MIEQVSRTECAKRLQSEKDSEENTNQLATKVFELKHRNAALTSQLHKVRKFLLKKQPRKMTHPFTKVNTSCVLVKVIKTCVV